MKAAPDPKDVSDVPYRPRGFVLRAEPSCCLARLSPSSSPLRRVLPASGLRRRSAGGGRRKIAQEGLSWDGCARERKHTGEVHGANSNGVGKLRKDSRQHAGLFGSGAPTEFVERVWGVCPRSRWSMAPAAEVKRPRWADMEDSDGEQHDRAGGWQQWADTSNEEHHAAGESSSAAPSEHTESKAHVSTLHLKRCVGGKKAAVTNGDNANLRAKGQLSEARKAYEELKSDMPKEVVESFETAWNLFNPLVGRPQRENRYVQAWVRKSRVDYCRKVLNEYQRAGGQATLGLKFILQDVKDISCKCNGMNHNILLNAVKEKASAGMAKGVAMRLSHAHGPA
ncbi:unnamed protein product [Prorocentrum cordatum]|uniref:Uncharacterized protein n=1 Tax=Prorocentrum cordatum TaxID=2364126 RepID=A0ABN9YFU2_9DINO|nr:unnamed protein product [Polarella glacialis]